MSFKYASVEIKFLWGRRLRDTHAPWKSNLMKTFHIHFFFFFWKPFILFKVSLYFCGRCSRYCWENSFMHCRDFARIALAGKICVAYIISVQTSSLENHYFFDINIWKISQLIPKWTRNNPNLMHPARVFWRKNCTMFFCWATDHLISLTVR